MAATNDARQAMKQIIRAERGGRRARNKAERTAKRGERLYLERMLCGHVEEAAGAFCALWNDKRTRRRLRRVLASTQPARAGLALLERELLGTRAPAFRKNFLQPIRNNWAFHYLYDVYQRALDGAGDAGEVIVAKGSGLSRYLVVDELIEPAMRKAAGGTPEAYDTAIRTVIRLAHAIGQVVDGLLMGLLRSRNVNVAGRNYVVVLERGLARGQREAAARRAAAAGGSKEPT